MVYLVRHGHAGRKAEWDGPDLARPLSAIGRRQAAGLVVRRRHYPVHRILCSPADRCRQTVEPLARHRGVAVEATSVLGVDATADGVLELLGDPTARVLPGRGAAAAEAGGAEAAPAGARRDLLGTGR